MLGIELFEGGMCSDCFAVECCSYWNPPSQLAHPTLPTAFGLWGATKSRDPEVLRGKAMIFTENRPCDAKLGSWENNKSRFRRGFP